MNNPGFDISRYATGWDTAVAPRIAFAVLGALIVTITLRTIWKRDCSVLAAVLWLIAGATFLAFSIIPQQIINSVVKIDYMTRVRGILGGLSVFVLLITLESIRRVRLQERYALLWVGTATVILLAALFPHVVDLLRVVTGIGKYVNAVVTIAFTFLVLVAFHFSISHSAMQSKQSRIAQKVAMLEARLKELERASSEPKKQETSPR